MADDDEARPATLDLDVESAVQELTDWVSTVALDAKRFSRAGSIGVLQGVASFCEACTDVIRDQIADDSMRLAAGG